MYSGGRAAGRGREVPGCAPSARILSDEGVTHPRLAFFFFSFLKGELRGVGCFSCFFSFFLVSFLSFILFFFLLPPRHPPLFLHPNTSPPPQEPDISLPQTMAFPKPPDASTAPRRSPGLLEIGALCLDSDIIFGFTSHLLRRKAKVRAPRPGRGGAGVGATANFQRSEVGGSAGFQHHEQCGRLRGAARRSAGAPPPSNPRTFPMERSAGGIRAREIPETLLRLRAAVRGYRRAVPGANAAAPAPGGQARSDIFWRGALQTRGRESLSGEERV